MNPERWQQVREILDKAIALPEGERSAYLMRLANPQESAVASTSRPVQH